MAPRPLTIGPAAVRQRVARRVQHTLDEAEIQHAQSRARNGIDRARRTAHDAVVDLGSRRIEVATGPWRGLLASVARFRHLPTVPPEHARPLPAGVVRDPAPLAADLRSLDELLRRADEDRAAVCVGAHGIAARVDCADRCATIAFLVETGPAALALGKAAGRQVLGRIVGGPLLVGGGLAVQARVPRSPSGLGRLRTDARAAQGRSGALVRAATDLTQTARLLASTLDDLVPILDQQAEHLAALSGASPDLSKLAYPQRAVVRTAVEVLWAVRPLLAIPLIDDRGAPSPLALAHAATARRLGRVG